MTDIPSYIDWKVGDKVVCIDGAPGFVGRNRQARIGETFPVVGAVYTIREIGPLYARYGYGNRIIVRLEEIVNATIQYRQGKFEGGFRVERFRPVQTKKTSIEIFNRILLNPRIRISEDA